MLVYLITCLPTGRHYVGIVYGRGQTAEKRWLEHCRSAKEGRRLFEAIKEHGPVAFNIRVIDTAATREELSLKEKHYIKKFDSFNSGYNGNTGGSNVPDSPSQETRRKIGRARQGRLHTAESKRRISRALTGIKRPFKTSSMKGRKHTRAAVSNMRAAKQRQRKPLTTVEKTTLGAWLRFITS